LGYEARQNPIWNLLKMGMRRRLLMIVSRTCLRQGSVKAHEGSRALLMGTTLFIAARFKVGKL
jgi:hypothetical protein